MLCKINTSFVLLGFVCCLVTAAPAPSLKSKIKQFGENGKRQIVIPSSTFPTEVSPDGTNFRFPLSNAFPSPSADQLRAINVAAQGSFSNNTPPATISQNGITNLQFVAFNELFEVAFFTDLLKNVTQNVPGYETPSGVDPQYLINTLTTIQAQEQLHALNANNGLRNVARVSPILPCEYRFPSTSLQQAIWIAQTFTDVVLGTLQDVLSVYATQGDTGFVRGQASSLGQEGEQNGFFRYLQGKVPSAQPFLTTATRSLAFSALVQNFIVPGSCPNVANGNNTSANSSSIINLSVFQPLKLETQGQIQAVNQQLSFSFQQSGSSVDGLSLVLISGQNRPIVQSLQNVTVSGGSGGNSTNTITFSSDFAVQDRLLFGLTIAVIARGDATTLTSIGTVDAATVYGPALIQVS